MTPEVQQQKGLEGARKETPQGESFLDNLRHLWRNFLAAVVRTGQPTSDRARTQKVFGNFLLHVHSTRVHLHSLRFSTTLGLGVAALSSFFIAAALWWTETTFVYSAGVAATKR